MVHYKLTLVILLLYRGFSDACRGRQKQSQKHHPTEYGWIWETLRTLSWQLCWKDSWWQNEEGINLCSATSHTKLCLIVCIQLLLTLLHGIACHCDCNDVLVLARWVMWVYLLIFGAYLHVFSIKLTKDSHYIQVSIIQAVINMMVLCPGPK